MSPDNLDALINAAAWGHQQIGTFGPGIGLAAGVWVLVRVPRALRRAGKQIDEWLNRIRWNNSTAIKPATEQYSDDCAEMRRIGDLIACEQIMRATEQRGEG